MTTTATPESFQERLAFWMFRRKLKAPALAARTGRTGQTIRNWRDGATQPSHGDVLSLAVALDIPVEELDPAHPQAGIRWTATGESKSRGSRTGRNRNGRGAVRPGNTRPGGARGPAEPPTIELSEAVGF